MLTQKPRRMALLTAVSLPSGSYFETAPAKWCWPWKYRPVRVMSTMILANAVALSPTYASRGDSQPITHMLIPVPSVLLPW